MSREPRWRLDLDDDATITFDDANQTVTKISTGETCDLRRYPTLEVDGRTLHVTSGHAPPLGKWYISDKALSGRD